MIRIFLCWVGLCLFQTLFAQAPIGQFSRKEVGDIMSALTAESMGGRGNYSPELFTAASYIANRFGKAGLKPFKGFPSFYQPFGLRDDATLPSNSKGPYQTENLLLNIVGVLKGRSRPEQIVVFSAHYDHMGYQKGTLHPGANDNASGTTALLLLADYFSRRKDNERTILFCAFSGEELGLLGSSAFAETIQADSVVAVVNIEMLGLSTVGPNALFVTGAQHSNFEKLFREGLPKTVQLVPEPNEKANLFFRSDNYPFALKGVPAHSIMSSTDEDLCYHRPCDETFRMDLDNMTRLVQAIAQGSAGLIKGTHTPTRISRSRMRLH